MSLFSSFKLSSQRHSSVNRRRDSTPRAMTADEVVQCTALLSKAEMFKCVPPKMIQSLVGEMYPRTFQKNEILLLQGQDADRFYLLDSGEVRRVFIDPEDGKHHNVEFMLKAVSINSMRIISGEPVFSTVKCVSDKCKLYEMPRDRFLQKMKEQPELAINIAQGLCDELRAGSKKFSTPLLEQTQQDINVPAVSIAAGIESYYRSALNAILNARLTGIKAELFPQMHIQVPVRIAYITGFKGLRHWLDDKVDPDEYDSPNLVRLTAAIAPGIIMTPVSSILEASNAGHMNKETMVTRWMRGVVPRAGREIIFGVGINQLSDYCEERMVPYFGKENSVMSNAAGSLLAGVVSGYLSHVPHNMSTFKLLEPQRSYADLYKMFVDKSCPPMIDNAVKNWSPSARNMARTLFATLCPKGVMIRTTQIVGSFMILNGTINYLQLREHHKIQKAIGQL